MRTRTRCKAAGASCGEPKGLLPGEPGGWHRGGRCPRCRTARWAELERATRLGPDRREAVLAALRAGVTLDAPAGALGVPIEHLAAFALRDSEVQSALAGHSLEQQLRARRHDFLTALRETEGDRELAAWAVVLDVLEAVEWLADPAYAAEEALLLTAVAERVSRPRRRIADELLDRAAELLETGATITEAARRVGVATGTLRSRSGQHPRLAAALPPKR
ncbi:hypothetical protein [Streptomyces daqingensis]|uniref:hypothetical protein n=1 Tax=Streptomyces daqingensis TaxID=1472640 RepID=UPI00166CA400|nr:hypothetical protein [Streptomyces daqingensis]